MWTTVRLGGITATGSETASRPFAAPHPNVTVWILNRSVMTAQHLSSRRRRENIRENIPPAKAGKRRSLAVTPLPVELLVRGYR